MSYRLEILPRARRDLAKLPATIRQRIDRKLLSLTDNPRPPDARAMKGRWSAHLRVRVGDYRIIYRVEDDRLLVVVIRIGDRRDVYE